jgi:hypothetical protein
MSDFLRATWHCNPENCTLRKVMYVHILWRLMMLYVLCYVQKENFKPQSTLITSTSRTTVRQHPRV